MHAPACMHLHARTEDQLHERGYLTQGIVVMIYRLYEIYNKIIFFIPDNTPWIIWQIWTDIFHRSARTSHNSILKDGIIPPSLRTRRSSWTAISEPTAEFIIGRFNNERQLQYRQHEGVAAPSFVSLGAVRAVRRSASKSQHAKWRSPKTTSIRRNNWLSLCAVHRSASKSQHASRQSHKTRVDPLPNHTKRQSHKTSSETSTDCHYVWRASFRFEIATPSIQNKNNITKHNEHRSRGRSNPCSLKLDIQPRALCHGLVACGVIFALF